MAKNKNKALLLALERNSKKDKSPALELTIKHDSNIYILICKPISEQYYSISINDVNNSELVDRYDVPQYIAELAPKVTNIQEYTKSFKQFIIMVEENEIHLLENIEEDLEKYSFYKDAMKKDEKKTDLFSSVIDKVSKIQHNIFKI